MRKYVLMTIFAAALIFFVPKGFNSVFKKAVLPQKQQEFTLILTEKDDRTITISAEEYLTGCLFAQIDISYNIEALKAQAAAAYTYALRLTEEGQELYDSAALCQPYFTPQRAKEYYGDSYEKYLPKLKEAAAYGAEHPIYYEGKPIYSVYHSVSAGATNRPEYVWGISLPYLTRVDCPEDKEYKNFYTENELSGNRARELLMQYDPSLNMPVDYALWFTDAVKDENGYVMQIRVGDRTITGGELSKILKLRSAAFEISWTGMVFSVTAAGYGHGVGMSQYTANKMAWEGKTAEEILEYFYVGADIRQ